MYDVPSAFNEGLEVSLEYNYVSKINIICNRKKVNLKFNQHINRKLFFTFTRHYYQYLLYQFIAHPSTLHHLLQHNQMHKNSFENKNYKEN